MGHLCIELGQYTSRLRNGRSKNLDWIGVSEHSLFSTASIQTAGPIPSPAQWVPAAPLLKRLIAGVVPCRPGFDPRLVEVISVVDRVALGQAFV